MTELRSIIRKRFEDMSLPEKLTLAAHNIEQARTTGCAEHLAGWEHLVVREAVAGIGRLQVAYERYDAAVKRQKGGLISWLFK